MVALEVKRVSRPERDPGRGAEGTATVTELADAGLREPSATTAGGETPVLEPGADWLSETLSDKAARQLQRLAAPLETLDLTSLLAPSFRCSPLLPETLIPDFRHGSLSVSRPPPERAPVPPPLTTSEELTRSISLLRGSASGRAADLEFKLYAIDLSPESETFSTKILVEVRGPVTDANSKQINASWICSWTRPDPETDAEPLLLGIEIEEYEEVTLTRATSASSPTLFTDATAQVLGHLPHYAAQVQRGIEFWSERLTRYGDMYLTGHHGIALGDVNGDGLEDVYACDGGSLPNRLYLQNPDGTVADASAQSQVDFLEDSRGALLIDLDNDGDLDLVVATVAMILFTENDGSGVFTVRGGHPGAPYPASISAADYDNDGDLDLYACIYEAGNTATGARWFEARTPIPFNDAQNGGRNVLLENLGGFQFRDVTEEAGLAENNNRWSFAASWEDYDQDGDPDLYVANDFGRNNLYRNDITPDGARRFIDTAAEAGVEDMAAGMSVAWGDPNRDGHMDLYVGNMFSAAGNRVAYQRQFANGLAAENLAGIRRMARGNSLFQAIPETGRFADLSDLAGVAMGRWAWSSAFADVNNDGWEDIVIANGYLTNTRDSDL